MGGRSAYSRRSRIENVACSAANHRIDLRVCTDIAVTNCAVDDTQQGIFSSAGRCNGIPNCTAEDASVGIALYAEEWSTIQANKVAGNQLRMIASEATCSWIVGNLVVENELSGIRLSKESDSTTVKRNEVAENGTGILVLDSDHVMVRGNQVKTSGVTGLYLSGAVATSVSDNLFVDNGLDIRTERGTCATVIRANALPGDGPAIRSEEANAVDARNDWGHDGRLLCLRPSGWTNSLSPPSLTLLWGHWKRLADR